MNAKFVLVQARLGELEQQRRLCLEATTDATTALIAAASTAAAPAVATSELPRVRELEGHVAQLRSALRRATTDATPDGKGSRSPAVDGGSASPVKGDARSPAARSGPDQQGVQVTGDKKAVDTKSALAATQVQLRMARQLVLSEQDRASHAEVLLLTAVHAIAAIPTLGISFACAALDKESLKCCTRM